MPGWVRRRTAGCLSHARETASFMNKISSSTDSLGPDSTDSNVSNLRKSAKSVDDRSALPNGVSGASDIEGKAATGSGERGGSRSSFNSRKVYVSGTLHKDIKVPLREISLAPTKSMNGQIEINEPVRVYDTSGPWGDNRFDGEVEEGLPPLRAAWIRARGDVEEIEGRKVQPIDDGYLSESHPAHAERKRPTSNVQRPIRRWIFGVRRSAFPEEFFERNRIRSPSSITRAAASSPQKWNSSRSVKISDARGRESNPRIAATDAKRLNLKSKIENLKYRATILRTNTSENRGGSTFHVR